MIHPGKTMMHPEELPMTHDGFEWISMIDYRNLHRRTKIHVGQPPSALSSDRESLNDQSGHAKTQEKQEDGGDPRGECGG
jgi:hypothetical protein